jgi:gamma-glutamyltranspeptidase
MSPDTRASLEALGHQLQETRVQGVAEVIRYDAASDVLEGGVDRRQPDGGAATK